MSRIEFSVEGGLGDLAMVFLIASLSLLRFRVWGVRKGLYLGILPRGMASLVAALKMCLMYCSARSMEG